MASYAAPAGLDIRTPPVARLLARAAVAYAAMVIATTPALAQLPTQLAARGLPIAIDEAPAGTPFSPGTPSRPSPEPDGAALAPLPVSQGDQERAPRTRQLVDDVLYDWTSVDAYHRNPPKYNALGKFEERWYAAHSFTEIGACIASLSEGDMVRVDGVRVRVDEVFYASYELSYAQARRLVGDESYCFQTCTDIGTGIRIAVCHPA